MIPTADPTSLLHLIGGLCGLMLAGAIFAAFAQSVVGAGIPGGRAGLDALLGRVKCTSNVSGANANTDITVSGIAVGDTVLSVIAGDGTDLGAAVVTVTAADTIQCDTSTASKKLTVIWIAATSSAPSQGTEYDAEWGILDTLLGTKLRASVVAGANGAITLTGIATTDTVIGLFLTDATADLSGSAWAVTANTLTPTPTIDTSSKHVVVLWIDESASSASNGQDWNGSFGSMKGGTLNRILSGLRISAGTGPAAAAADVTSGSFANMAETDNLLALWFDTSATDPLDAVWTMKSGGGGLTRDTTTTALNGGSVHALWIDISATGLVAA